MDTLVKKITPAGDECTEAEMVEAVVHFLQDISSHGANFDVLRRELPRYVALTPADWEPTSVRHMTDKRWHTKLRNIASHKEKYENRLVPMRGGGYWLAETAEARRKAGRSL